MVVADYGPSSRRAPAPCDHQIDAICSKCYRPSIHNPAIIRALADQRRERTGIELLDSVKAWGFFS